MRKVLLGVGNPLGRDDGVGVWVAERLADSDWTTVPAGQAPENVTGLLRRLCPDLLVVVDAADMRLPPGSFRRLPLSGVEGMLGSSHALPLSFLLSLLRELAREVVLIGVQPADLSLGEGLSPEVAAGADRLTALLREGRLSEIPSL